MVVRLNDIRQGTNENKNSGQVVRLSDLRGQSSDSTSAGNQLVRLSDIKKEKTKDMSMEYFDRVRQTQERDTVKLEEYKTKPKVVVPSPSNPVSAEDIKSGKVVTAPSGELTAYSPNNKKVESPRTITEELAYRDAERDKILPNNAIGQAMQNMYREADRFLLNNPVGSFITRFGQSGAQTLGQAPFHEAPETGSKVADTVADVGGTIGSIFVNPGGVTSVSPGQASIVGQVYNNPAVQRLSQSAASRVSNPTASRVVNEAVREGITGAVEGGAMTLARGGSEHEALQNALLGGVLGGSTGAVFPLAEQGVRRLMSPRQSTRATETPVQANNTPERVNTSPQPVESQMIQPNSPTMSNERGFVRTLEQSGRLSDDVQSGLRNSETRQYQPITNAETVAKANQRIAKSVDDAEAYVLRKGKTDAEQIATGMRLIDELQRRGQTQRAVTIAESLAEKLTAAGQTVQAASIWNRLTPEGALLAAQRKVNTINREATRLRKPVELTEKNADDIMTAAGAIQRSGASQELSSRVMDIAERMKRGENVTSEEMQMVSEFVKDMKSFVRPPRQPRPPKTMSDKRVRDKVVSFFDQQEQAAKERLRARGIRISSTPLDVWADYAVIGASKLAKGSVKFADWSQQMINDFGDEVRPYLSKIYDRAVDIFNQDTQRISEQTYSQAEKIASSYLKKNASRMDTDDAQFIRDLAQQVSELSGTAQRQASQDLQAILNGFERAGVGRKVSSLQYISMLLNPVTQVRNILGNELLYRLERVMRTIATPIDIAASKVSGKDRQITFRSGPFTWENFFAPTKDYWKGLIEGSSAGWRGINPEGLTTAYDISGQAFRSKLNPVTYLEKTLGAVMKGFDYAAFTRASNQRLREMAYLDALNKGVKGRKNIQDYIDRYIANLDDNIASVAKEYGKFVTLQDDTVLSKGLSSLKRGLNKVSTGGLTSHFGAGSLILPFAKTPANLLNRAIEYSPAGFLKAIYQTGEVLLKPNTDLTRADVIQSVTRALLGTGLTGAAVWLADLGVIKGDTPGDKDVRNLERQSGLSQFQINGSALQRVMNAMITGNMDDVKEAAKIRLDDTLWQYEWAQPASVPIAVGANIAQERQQARRSDEPQSLLNQSVDVVTGGLNTLFNTSLLQGLQEAFDFQSNEENKVKAFVENLAKQVPSMFTPSMLNRINQYTDDAQRESYSNNLYESMINQIRSRTPGLSQQLPQRVDTLGQPMKRENNFFDVFLSPSIRTKYQPSETAQFVFDLLSETGDERIAPRTVPRYITGTDRQTRQSVRIDLSPEQFVRYQEIVGQETVRLIDRINPNLPTQKKVEKVIDALNKAGEKGRREMRRELGLR